MRGLRPGLQILDRRPFTPLRHRLRVDPQLTAQRRERSLRSLYAARTACVVPSTASGQAWRTHDERVPYGPFHSNERSHTKPWDQTPRAACKRASSPSGIWLTNSIISSMSPLGKVCKNGAIDSFFSSMTNERILRNTNCMYGETKHDMLN